MVQSTAEEKRLTRQNFITKRRGGQLNSETFFHKFRTLIAVAEMSYTQYTVQLILKTNENLIFIDIYETTFFY